MKKQMMALSAMVMMATATVPSAHALFVGKWLDDGKAAVQGLVDKAANKAHEVAGKLQDKAQEAANQALNAAGSLVKHTMDKMATAAKAATGDARKFLETKAQEYAKQAPKWLQPLVKKGIQVGKGGLRSIEKKLNAGIDGLLVRGKGLTDKYVGIGKGKITELRGLLQSHVSSGIELARKIAQRKVARTAKQMTRHVSGLAGKFAGLFSTVKSAPVKSTKAVKTVKPVKLIAPAKRAAR